MLLLHFTILARPPGVAGFGGAAFEQGPGYPDGQLIAWLIYIWTKIVWLTPNALILKDQMTSDWNKKGVLNVGVWAAGSQTTGSVKFHNEKVFPQSQRVLRVVTLLGNPRAHLWDNGWPTAARFCGVCASVLHENGAIMSKLSTQTFGFIKSEITVQMYITPHQLPGRHTY